jgi:hypothetical protein
MIGFYPRVGFTFGSKKVITWFFNQVLKRGFRFLSSGLGFNPWILKMIGFYPWVGSTLRIKEGNYLVFQPSLEERVSNFILESRIQPSDIEDDWFLFSSRFYPQVKEGDYMVFNQVLKNGSRFLPSGSDSHLQVLVFTIGSWFLSSCLGWNRLWNLQDMLKFLLSKFFR